jgi:hypothetical protein
MITAIEPLGKHDRAAFSCGVAALDDWFRHRASQDEKCDIARVFVAIDDRHGVVGFYSLSSFTLAIADLPPSYAKRLPRYEAIPAALIGRLARGERVRGEGIGDLLLADAVRRIVDASRSLAAFAIVVDATNEAAAAFIATSALCPSRAGRFACSCQCPKRPRRSPVRCPSRPQAGDASFILPARIGHEPVEVVEYARDQMIHVALRHRQDIIARQPVFTD